MITEAIEQPNVYMKSNSGDISIHYKKTPTSLQVTTSGENSIISLPNFDKKTFKIGEGAYNLSAETNYGYMVDGKILGGMFTQGNDGTVSATISETVTMDKTLKESPEEVAEVLKAVGYTDDEIKKIQEIAPEKVETFDMFAELPIEKIDSILEEVGTIEMTSSETEMIKDSSEESGISEESDTLEGDSITEKESLTEDEPETESEEVAASNGSIPDISELPGTYGFVLRGQDAGYLPGLVGILGGDDERYLFHGSGMLRGVLLVQHMGDEAAYHQNAHHAAEAVGHRLREPDARVVLEEARQYQQAG